jgi:spermidine synthase
MQTSVSRQVSFRVVIYAATFLSGAAGLIFQVVWQRYLSFLMGSEAKSISLVVAVFLFGLATGYQFWGNVTERGWSRQKLLKAVGFVELGIAVYGLLFPQLFGIVREMAYAAPDSLLIDLLFTLALLFVPTFLMGATIPLLTAAVPTSAEEVNHCHSRIYGINTLGAFLGALLAGFFLVPKHGLLSAMIAAAILDAAVGILFVLNRLNGDMQKARDVPDIPNAFGPWGIYLLVFVTGAASIGLEVLLIRLVGLSIGSGLFVFPIVVGIVVLGLAIGSLSLRRTGMTALRVPIELAKISAILIVLYLTAPYWGYWVSHARVSLTSIPTNYGVYLAIVMLFFAALLLPLMIPIGRLLPAGYALIHKTRSDYGKVCGRVYFANTLGTVVGAVVIGYVLFLWLNLPEIFKLTISMLLVLASFLLWRESRPKLAVAGVLAAVAVFFLPAWNRDLHYFSLHRAKSIEDFHFKGLFNMPQRVKPGYLLMMRDDPNSTVALAKVDNVVAGTGQTVPSKAISVNGKPDGDTLGDYSNMVLTGVLPYLYSSHENGLNAAIVGLGSGMTSGALALGQDVQSVTTLELSSSVIEAAPLIREENFNVVGNPKTRFVQNDAFRFFSRNTKKFDIIISEPSNPWVVGIENLFTPEFYGLVARSLAEDGVFCQWVQTYSIDQEIFMSVCRNVLNQFEHAGIYIVGPYDMAILASNVPLSAPHRERRLHEEGISAAMAPMALNDSRLFSILERHPSSILRALVAATPARTHTMEYPWIGHAAAKTLFLGHQLEIDATVFREVGRHLPYESRRRNDFASFMADHSADLSTWHKPDLSRHSALFVSVMLSQLAIDYQRLNSPGVPLEFITRLESYARLRENGFIEANVAMLDQMVDATIAAKNELQQPYLSDMATLLAREYALEWQWDKAVAAAQRLGQAGILSAGDVENVRTQTADYRDRVNFWRQLLQL